MNMFLFFSLLAMLALACLWIGRKASSNMGSNEDYYLGGRNFGFFGLTLTLLATQLGGGTILGSSQEAYQKGWIVLFYPLGMAIGLFLLGAGLGARMRKMGLTTVVEVFEKIYGSAKLRQAASLLSIASLFFILVAQGIAARTFFFSLGCENPIYFILFWLVLVTYTVVGGLRAVVNTDILQGCFIIGAFLIAVGFLFWNDPSSLPQQTALFQTQNVPWTGWLLMPLLFMIIGQDMGQRCFAAKTPRTISLAAITASIVFFVASLLPIYLGTLAAKLGISIPEGGSVLIETVKRVTNPTVSAFMMCAVLMAIISTADSLLCSISSLLSCDFPLVRRATGKKSVIIAQVLTFVVGMLTLGLSFLLNDVVAAIIFSYELSVLVLAVPIVMALLCKKVALRSAMVSMFFGILGFITSRYIQFGIPKEICVLSISLAGFWISEAFDRYASKVKVES